MINGGPGHRGLRAGSPSSRERGRRGHLCHPKRQARRFTRIILGGEQLHFEAAAEPGLLRATRQTPNTDTHVQQNLALPILAKKVINHSLRFTLVLLLFSSTISRSSSCKVSRAFSMLAPRRTPHLCCSCHRIRLENSLWYFRSLISRASQTWHLLSTLLI